MKPQGIERKEILLKFSLIWIFSDLSSYVNAVVLPLVFLESVNSFLWLSQLQPPACCQISVLCLFLHVLPFTSLSFPKNLLPPPALCRSLPPSTLSAVIPPSSISSGLSPPPLKYPLGFFPQF